MTGEYQLEVPRDVVWRALNDPEILRQSIPGCDTVEKLSETELSARVTIQIGPVKAKFSGKVALSDLDPPRGYTISGEGQGGVAGFGKGRAEVRLEELDGGAATKLHYVAEAQVSGKIAQLGARLIDATAKKLADEFFSRFATAVGVISVSADVLAPGLTARMQTGEASVVANAAYDTRQRAPGPLTTDNQADGRLPQVLLLFLLGLATILLWWFASS